MPFAGLSLGLCLVPACAVSPSSTAPSPESTGSALGVQEARQIVAFHNRVRAEVGVEKVEWSSEIARYAQQRADSIARAKRFAHLPSGQNPYGENLAQGGGGFGVVEACEGWYAERAKMPGNARLMTPALFNRGVGHYTQMIWRDSARIGAGIARYEKNGFVWTVVVCCYDPPGNAMGREIW